MDKKFLNKVVDQIMSETTIDMDGERGRMYTPLPFPSFLTSLTVFELFSSFNDSDSYVFTFFSDHCEDVYGLNKKETEYVWEEYKQIIIDKIENNG